MFKKSANQKSKSNNLRKGALIKLITRNYQNCSLISANCSLIF